MNLRSILLCKQIHVFCLFLFNAHHLHALKMKIQTGSYDDQTLTSLSFSVSRYFFFFSCALYSSCSSLCSSCRCWLEKRFQNNLSTIIEHCVCVSRTSVDCFIDFTVSSRLNIFSCSFALVSSSVFILDKKPRRRRRLSDGRDSE